jgi:YD repeat-containing protein
MKKKVVGLYVIFFGISLIAFLSGYSQAFSGDNSMQYNKSASPSGPTNIFLSSGASLGVDLYTGKLQASLPILTLESSDIKIPISIAYTAGGGVKPQDLITTTGIGWMINAGGSITRTVRGLPDEMANGYIGTNNKGVLVVSGFNNPNNNTTGFPIYFNNTFNRMVSSSPNVDGEPDIFVIQTPFFALKFTLDENGIPVTQGGNTGIKITHSMYKNSAAALYLNFVVTDDAGNQYYFGSGSATRETSTTKFFGESFTFISTWYLEKIVTYNSKDIVNFSYMQGQNDTAYFYQLSKSYTSTFNSSPTFPPVPPPASFSNPATRPASISTVIFNQPKYISQIVTKLGQVDFTYTYHSNPGVNGAHPPKLTKITVKQLNPVTGTNNITLKTFDLNFSEFYSGITGWTVPFPYYDLWSIYYKRLLSSVTVTGSTSATSTPITLYSLRYNQDQAYPEKALPQNCDYWGYVNSTTFNPDGGTNGGADLNYFTSPEGTRQPTFYDRGIPIQSIPTASLLSLEQIDNLSGETAIINYENNTVFNGTFNGAVGGCRVYNITHKLPTGESLATNYVYNLPNGNSSGQLYNDFYKRVMHYFGTTCCNFETLVFSQSPYSIADNNGTFLGYSAVKVIVQNGGYEINNFTNFSDYPDIITPQSLFAGELITSPWGINSGNAVASVISSFAYKRGLLKNKVIYNAANSKISETVNTYSSLDAQPAVKEIGAQDMTWWLTSGSTYGTSTQHSGANLYSSNIENWRLTQTLQKDYDQNNVNNFIQTTNTFTYCPDKRLLKSITTTDSKSQTFTKTFYHANDIAIPLITTAEQTALTAMVNANLTNALVHQTASRNGVITQNHNTYGVAVGNTNQGFSNTYLLSSTNYNGALLINQQINNFDALNSNLLSTQALNGKTTSFAYGYKSSLPVATIENAANTISYQSNTITNYLAVPGSNYSLQSTSFTTYYPGTITISMPPGSYLAGSVTCFFYFTLTGAGSGSGNLCNNSAAGYTCSAPNTVSFPNMPAGTYSLSVTPYTNTAASSVSVGYTYNSTQASQSTEFFLENFEQNAAAVSGSSHTGNMYWNGNYTVTYPPANGKSYLVQWWNLAAGVWKFNEQAYTQNMILTGPVDDVRVFPNNALMTSYTYNTLTGKTSQTDPSGKSMNYQYDGLGRMQAILDQDKNVLKQYDYQYQILSAPVYNTVQSGTYTKNNCPSGYVGKAVTYTVAANTYTSFINLQDANQKAINDVAANGQAYANAQSTASGCLSNVLTVTGTTSFNVVSPSGAGTVSGVAGAIVYVTINANGATTNGYTITATVKNGSTTLATGTITNNSYTFSFVMPASGTASWNVTFTGANSNGGGGISFSY